MRPAVVLGISLSYLSNILNPAKASYNKPYKD